MPEGPDIRRIRLIALTVGTVAVLDQLTKLIVAHYLFPGETVEVIPGLFNLVYWKNPGAAFGIFKDGGLLRTLFLIGVSVAALVLIGILLRQSTDTFTDLSLSLIAGGAVGNTIDRVLLGEVVDFLDFHAGGWHWPAFNVADSAITVGVTLALISFYFKGAGKADGPDNTDTGG
ncbi:MAG: signal peptidase II [Thermodesulfobacteriota bacterium]